jgi:DNA-binding IclR family transcriptional regulator
MAGNTSQPGASVTSRVVALLRAFDSRHRRLTLTELAARAGLPVPTAHRLVGELVEHGVLVRQPDGPYVVGRLLWDIGLLAPLPTGLRELAGGAQPARPGRTRPRLHLPGRAEPQA